MSDAIAEVEENVSLPDLRRLSKVGGSGSRSIVIPKSILRRWWARFGEVREVEIYRQEDESIVIAPRGMLRR
jgi:hypothetical protein